jgi:hypothetical protein
MKFLQSDMMEDKHVFSTYLHDEEELAHTPWMKTM